MTKHSKNTGKTILIAAMAIVILAGSITVDSTWSLTNPTNELGLPSRCVRLDENSTTRPYSCFGAADVSARLTGLGTLIQNLAVLKGNDSVISQKTGIPLASLYFANGTPNIFYGLDYKVDNHGNHETGMLWCIDNQTWTYITGLAFAPDSEITKEFLETANVVSPQNVSMNRAVTGNALSWWIDDEDSFANKTYTILVNGTSNATGNWTTSTPITLNIDGIASGIYNYTLIATDCRGYGVNSTVIVNVYASAAALLAKLPGGASNVVLLPPSHDYTGTSWGVIIIVAGIVVLAAAFFVGGKKHGRKK
jgi:hypothetical protein